MRLRSALRATLCYIWRKHLHNLRQFPWRLVTLADDGATPEEKNQVKETWSGTNECCLPQGMARNWMAAGVDLDCPNILRFLHGLAFVTRMTVADIEVRHARNNQTAGTSGNLDFSQVVAEYIATEFSELVRSTVLSSAGPEALEQHAAPAPALPPAAAGPRPRKQRRVDGGPPLRGKCALHCFASDRRLGHLKGGGAFTADYWKKVREEFEALPAERRHAYEAQAQHSVLAARAARVAVAAQQEPQYPPVLEDTPAIPALADEPRPDPPHEELQPLCLNLVRKDLLLELANGEQVSVEFAGAVRSDFPGIASSRATDVPSIQSERRGSHCRELGGC